MVKQRLIDANTLDEKLEILKVRYKAQGRDAVAEDYNFVQTVLLTAPAVDAVPVVRCKDCKFWQESADGINKWCPLLRGKETNAYDFCSYGERRNPNG